MKTTNRYVSALAGMIDHSDLMSRKQWAQQLRVSEASITFWLQENTVPQPQRLKKIIDKVENSKNKQAHQYLDKFMHLVDEPVEKVTNIPHKFKHANTISEYLLRPNQEQLARTLTSLPHRVRARILEMTQELVADSFANIQFKGKSEEDVLKGLHRLETAEDENDAITQIFECFFVLLIKDDAGQLAQKPKPVLKKILSEGILNDGESTGAILELGDPDKIFNKFKDIDELLRIVEEQGGKRGEVLAH